MGRAAPFALGLALLLLVPAAASAQRPPCAACAVVTIQTSQAAALPERLPGLTVLVQADGAAGTARPVLAAVAERGGIPGLIVPADAMSVDGSVDAARVVLVDATAMATTFDEQAFFLKTMVTSLRAEGGAARTIGIIATAAQEQELLSRGVAPYIDVIVAGGLPSSSASTRRWVPAGVLTSALDAIARSRDSQGETSVWAAPADATLARVVLGDLAIASDVLPSGLAPADDIHVTCGGRAVEWFTNPQTLEHVAYALRCGNGDAIVPADLGTVRVALASGGALIRMPAAQDRFSDIVAVRGAPTLSAAEIIARHQAAAARQRSRVDTLVSSGTMSMTFEAPGFPAPVTVTSRATIYVDRGRTEIAQEDIRVNGIAFAPRGRPTLPILEPERVTSPPLAIALTDAYAYARHGEETVAKTRCYVVSFEPLRRHEPLFRGRAWISMDDFALVRVAAVQTALRGPIVASEQTDDFRRAGDGVWVLAQSDVRQTYEGAAHRTPIHRVLRLTAHEINAPDFEGRRASAYAAAAVMLRDTPEGYRYLDRQSTRAGSSASAARSTPAGAAVPAPTRTSTRIRTLAFGAIVDPNISRPLPFAGVSYVDFNLFGTGAQFNGFFGGTYGQLAVSVPSIRGTQWQVAGRAFAIASSFNDRSFRGGREVYDESLRQRPAQASVWVVRPLGARTAVRAGYDLDYTHLAAAELTARDFVAPADQVAHGVRLALEAQRSGWNGSVWWYGGRRAGWRAWGRGGADGYERGHGGYQRFGAMLTRSAVLAPRLAARGELSWMDGRDLDRFSRYAFGTFDNRLHGYPSALIRYDRGGVGRLALAFAATRALRLDGFADYAVVHDPGLRRGYSRFAGFGSAVEVPAPMGTLVAVEWGYGVQGIDRDGGRGTHVVRISGFKVF